MKEKFDDIEQSLWDQLGEIPVPEPIKDMKTRFHSMLDIYKNEVESKK